MMQKGNVFPEHDHDKQSEAALARLRRLGRHFAGRAPAQGRTGCEESSVSSIRFS